MLFDLHIHSKYSYDSVSKVDDILKVAKRRGLSGIAITDHESFDGSLEASAKAKHWELLVIPGMEVATEHGDVIGLFLQQKIASRTFLDVVREIKEQNGLVVLPHPFKRTKNIIGMVLQNIDLVEVFNARGEPIGNNHCNRRAYDLAVKMDIPMTAGSDAHFLFEIGRGCISIENVSSIEQIRERLLNDNRNKILRRPSSLQVEVLSQVIKGYKTRNFKIFKSAPMKFARALKWDNYRR